MIREGMIHNSYESDSVVGATAVSQAMVPAGRRISFMAWGLAASAGLAMWMTVFKLVI